MGMGFGDAIFTIFPILTFFFYIAPVVFVIWFLIKFLKVQQEKNEILRAIYEKMDQRKD